MPKMLLSSVLAFLKSVQTVRATLFPASTTEKWQPTTDGYRSNIGRRGRLPSANWSTGTRTSDDPAPFWRVKRSLGMPHDSADRSRRKAAHRRRPPLILRCAAQDFRDSTTTCWRTRFNKPSTQSNLRRLCQLRTTGKTSLLLRPWR